MRKWQRNGLKLCYFFIVRPMMNVLLILTPQNNIIIIIYCVATQCMYIRLIS